MKKITKLVGVITLLGALLGFSACSDSDDDKVTTEKYEISYTTQTGLSAEVSNYVLQRISDLNRDQFKASLDQGKAEGIFNSFCSSIVTEVKNKNFEVYSEASITLQLKNLASGSTAVEKQVKFIQTATPKYYVEIILKEIAPLGDTDEAGAYILGKLEPYSLTKTTENIGDQKEYILNKYSFYKEYPSFSDAENYFNPLSKGLDKLLKNISDEWPTDVLYTGGLNLTYRCLDSSTSSGTNGSANRVINNPILNKQTWKTTSDKAPFASIYLELKDTDIEEYPIFNLYNVTLDGTKANYSVTMIGKKLCFYDESIQDFKYIFDVTDSNKIKLASINGQAPGYDAFYEK